MALILIAVVVIILVSVATTPKRYAIDFYGNGSDSGNVQSMEVEEGERAMLPSSDYDRAGYHFVGWSTSPDGTDALVPGETVTVEDDLALYAAWEKNEYEATFEGGSGAKGETEAVSCEYQDSVTLPKCGFKRDGYLFDYWADTENGTKYEAGDDVVLEDDMSFEARWKYDPKTAFDVERFFVDTSDDGTLFVAVFARNKLEDTLDMQVQFEYFDIDGNSLGKTQSNWLNTAKDKLAFVFDDSGSLGNDSANRAASAEYEVVKVEKSTGIPVSSGVSIREAVYEADNLQVELTNDLDTDAEIHYVIIFGEGSYGGFLCKAQSVDQTLKPGESTTVTIDKPIDSSVNWELVTKRQYFVY